MSLFQKLSDYNSLKRAYDKISRNSNAAGIDGITPLSYGDNLKGNLKELSWTIKAMQYKNSPVILKEISKGAKTRTIGILTCSDRIVASSAANCIDDKIEPLLNDSCYAFRKGKSALHAVNTVNDIISKYNYSLKLDIKDFFDNIDRETLLSMLSLIVEDDDVIYTIKKCIEYSYIDDNKVINLDNGICQGSPLSPILSNLYMSEIDDIISADTEIQYFRYCDDILVLTKSHEQCQQILDKFLELITPLCLSINREKTKINAIEKGIEFLGFKFSQNGISASEKALFAIEQSLNDIWEEHKNEEYSILIDKLYQTYSGWLSFYKDEIAGGALGIIISLEKGLFSITTLVNYRKSIEVENKEVVIILSEKWFEAGQHIMAINELENILKIGYTTACTDDCHFVYNNLLKILNGNNLALRLLSEHYLKYDLYEKAKEISNIKLNKKVQPAASNFDYIGNTNINQDMLDKFKALFIQADNQYAIEQYMNDERKLLFNNKNITSELIKRHLACEIILDVPVVNDENLTNMSIMDIDISKEYLLKYNENDQILITLKENLMEYCKEIIKSLKIMNITAYLEESGRRGYHIWIFWSSKINNTQSYNITNSAINLTNYSDTTGISIEHFPDKRRVNEHFKGKYIKLPFGKHIVTDRRSKMYNEDITSSAQFDEFISSVIVNNANEVTLHNNPNEPKTQIIKVNDNNEILNDLSGDLGIIVSKCAIIRRLCLKSIETKFLTHYERLTLLYVLGHVGDDGKQYLHKIMSYTINYDRDTTEKFLNRIPKKPISCTRLKSELSYLGLDGCNCVFNKPKGVYDSPILHLSEDFSIDKDVTLPLWDSKDSKQANEYYHLKENVLEEINEILKLNSDIAKMIREKEDKVKSVSSLLNKYDIDQIDIGEYKITVGSNGKISLEL